LEWQDAARLLGGEWRVGYGEQQRPAAFRFNLDDLGLHLIRHAGYGDAAHPAGGRVVGMVLAHGRFAHNAVGFPAEMSVVDGERDSSQTGGSGRSAALADGDFVVNVNAERNDFAILGLENLAVGCED